MAGLFLADRFLVHIKRSRYNTTLKRASNLSGNVFFRLPYFDRRFTAFRSSRHSLSDAISSWGSRSFSCVCLFVCVCVCGHSTEGTGREESTLRLKSTRTECLLRIYDVPITPSLLHL